MQLFVLKECLCCIDEQLKALCLSCSDGNEAIIRAPRLNATCNYSLFCKIVEVIDSEIRGLLVPNNMASSNIFIWAIFKFIFYTIIITRLKALVNVLPTMVSEGAFRFICILHISEVKNLVLQRESSYETSFLHVTFKVGQHRTPSADERFAVTWKPQMKLAALLGASTTLPRPI